MAANDPDEEVRSTALMAWSLYHRDSRDPRILSRLADILWNKAEHPMVRSEAYRSILSVAGYPVEKWPRRAHNAWDIDEDVDWELVSQLVGR